MEKIGIKIDLEKEAAAGFAPANSGFADRRLATWLYRRIIDISD